VPDVTSIVLNAYDFQNPIDVLVKYLNACGVEADGEIRITPEGDFSVWLKIPNDMTPAEAVSWLFGKVTEHLDTRPFSVRFSTAMTLSVPPAPPEKPWYETVSVGTRLRVVRAEGLDVYTTPALSAVWDRGRLAVGNTSMTVAALYDAALDRTPPIGVLCVLNPKPPSFPSGLWVIAIGNDGEPNVENMS